MVLCKFFQQGSCRFGSKCVNEHLDVKQVIKADVDAAINGKQWPLSTYGPFKDKPSIPNFIEDQSFEEIRMLCYEAKQKNFFDQFHQQFTKEAMEASNKMKALLQMTPDIVDVVIKVYDMPSDVSSSGVTAGKSGVTGIGNPFGGSSAGSIFAKSNTATASNIFGNTTGNSIFASAPNNTQTPTSIFGNATALGSQQQQQGSMFAQTNTLQSNSIFGGGTTNTQQKPSIFAQQKQPQQTGIGSNIFASAAQNQQQPQQFGLFSQQNQQQQPAQQPSIFGQQQQIQPQNSNIFAQTTQAQPGLFAPSAQTIQQQQQPTQGLFGQTIQQQQPASSQGLFAQATQQTQSVFGQTTQQQQQQQQPNTNIFQQQQQSNSGQQQQMQNTPPTGLFQHAASQQQNQNYIQTPTQVSSTVYSRMEDLTAEEIEAFKAEFFQEGKIPFNPPPRELVN